jgi:alkanesulfonate monooxygenase SsuD/methylene tetrahydromethanopterin reductase-like flavin-dependent oxidoreductase (luciferase family)
VEFGLFLSLQHPADRVPAQLFEERLEQVRAARDLGFDSVFAGHHYLVPSAYQVFQTVPMIARIAVEAGEMTVGAGVLLATLLNPVDLAEQAATLQVICGGRFVLGVGRGYRQEEFDAFAVDRPIGDVFAEKVEIVRRLLDGEAVTASAEGYRIESATLGLRHDPRPPLWVAGTTDAAVRRGATLGDTWLIGPGTTPPEIARMLALFTEARGGIAPDVLPAIRDVAIADTDEEAIIAAEPLFNPRGTSAAVHSGVDDGRFVVGGPETAAERLRDLERAGVTHVLFRVQRVGVTHAQALRSLEVLARAVRPALEAGAA